MKLPKSYSGLLKALGGYWRDYGGWKEFLLSPLVHASAAVSILSYNVWQKSDWIDLPLSLLPNLLGFSLGAYALIFSLADSNLLSALDKLKDDEGRTYLRVINASFFHFILMQTLAIIFALSQKSSAFVDLCHAIFRGKAERRLIDWMPYVSGVFGYWLTIYAVFLLIGAALASYRLAVLSGRAASNALSGSASRGNQESLP